MSRARSDALQVALFPLLLTVGVILIPVVPDYSDHEAASRAVGQPARWLLGHLVSAVAFAASVQTSATLQRLSGQPRYWITALIAVGAGLHSAGLGADGIGPLAMRASPTTFFDGSAWLVPPVFMAGGVFFGLGQLAQTLRIQAQLSTRRHRVVAISAAAGFSLAEVVPSGWGLYAVALAALTLYLPFAALVWRHGSLSSTAPRGSQNDEC